MIQIFTDTSANLPAAYIQKYSLRVIPLHYSIDGVQAQQDPTVDFDGKSYYDAMRSLLTKCLGTGGTYYRYHSGKKLLTPEQQEWILNLFRRHGYTQGLEFEGYVEKIDLS